MLWRNQDRGQALLEFALVIPLLLLLVVGVVETARIVSGLLVLRHAAYDVVRAAAVGAGDTATRERAQVHVSNVVRLTEVTDWYEVDPETGAGTFAVRFGPAEAGEWVEMRLTPRGTGRRQGGTLRVELIWGFRPVFLGWILDEALTLTVTSVGRVEYPAD